MAIKGHLDQAAAPDGTRGSTRRALRLDALAASASGVGAGNATVHNISADGLLIETALPLGPGEALTLALPEAGPVTAVIVWSSAPFYGCAFERPLTPAALAAAQLQGEAARPAAPDAASVPAAPSALRGASQAALGARINRLRREAGLTLADVAAALGVSKPTVWAWEKGKARPLPERIDAIAQALGVASAELSSGDGAAQEAEKLIAECRVRIAAAYGVATESVRIMIDL